MQIVIVTQISKAEELGIETEEGTGCFGKTLLPFFIAYGANDVLDLKQHNWRLELLGNMNIVSGSFVIFNCKLFILCLLVYPRKATITVYHRSPCAKTRT